MEADNSSNTINILYCNSVTALIYILLRKRLCTSTNWSEWDEMKFRFVKGNSMSELGTLTPTAPSGRILTS